MFEIEFLDNVREMVKEAKSKGMDEVHISSLVSEILVDSYDIELSEAQETFSTKYQLCTWNLSPARDKAPRGPIARAGTRTTPRSRRRRTRCRRARSPTRGPTAGNCAAARRSAGTFTFTLRKADTDGTFQKV